MKLKYFTITAIAFSFISTLLIPIAKADIAWIRATDSDARLNGANLSGITATNLRGCPFRLPNGWVCEKNTIQICSYTTLIYNI